MFIFLSAINEVEQILKANDNVKCSDITITAPNSNSKDIFSSILNVNIPDSLLQIYTTETEALKFSWIAEPDVFGPDCSRGNISLLSPNQVKSQLEDQREQAQEAKENGLIDDEGYAVLAEDWPHWLPVFSFPSGDCFCLDMREDECPVVFLEHDVMDAGPNLHGLRIAPNLESLIALWRQILFVDLFDWTQGVNESGIDIDSRIFKPFFQIT